jgi:hypothetical protein
MGERAAGVRTLEAKILNAHLRNLGDLIRLDGIKRSRSPARCAWAHVHLYLATARARKAMRTRCVPKNEMAEVVAIAGYHLGTSVHNDGAWEDLSVRL